jgi:hypothetical protein
MSEEKFEYAEKILVKLRDNAKEQTQTVGEIIGKHAQKRNQQSVCSICNSRCGPVHFSRDGHGGWIGDGCRGKLPNQFSYSGHVRCVNCGEHKPGKRQVNAQNHWGICDNCISESGSGGHIIEKSEVDKELKTVRAAKSKLKTSKQTAAEKAIPYINAGLAESFALAIARGTDDGEILDLWESEWWKQYKDDDMLIVAVLEGRLTEDQGKYLNSIRSDHERLALTCVEDPKMIEWASTLLIGFDEVPEAVNDALDGGQPHIIARIRKMKVNAELLPPALKKPVLLKNPPKHMQLIPEKTPLKKRTFQKRMN